AVLDTDGKPVDMKHVLKTLKKGELLALATSSMEAVDPIHLRLIREGTWIIVLPSAAAAAPASPVAAPPVDPILPPPAAPPRAPLLPPATRLPLISPPSLPITREPLPTPPAPPMVERQDGARARVGQIIIVGNETTRDRKIREATGLLPGAVLTFEDL